MRGAVMDQGNFASSCNRLCKNWTGNLKDFVRLQVQGEGGQSGPVEGGPPIVAYRNTQECDGTLLLVLFSLPHSNVLDPY